MLAYPACPILQIAEPIRQDQEAMVPGEHLARPAVMPDADVTGTGLRARRARNPNNLISKNTQPDCWRPSAGDSQTDEAARRESDHPRSLPSVNTTISQEAADAERIFCRRLAPQTY